jgi:hypothetical protein
MKARAKQILAELKRIAPEGEANLFQRIKLAAELLADTDWLGEQHGGDEDRAGEWLEAEFFASLCGYVPLLKVVAVFRKFPSEATWAEYRYNLRALEALYDEARATEAGDQKPSRKTATLKQVQELEQKVSEAEYAAKRERTEADRLRDEVAALKNENAELRGRVAELERIVDRRLAAVA